MRLYNAQSCTPAATTASTKWSPPPTFVPRKGVNYNAVAVAVAVAGKMTRRSSSNNKNVSTEPLPYPLPLSLTASCSHSFSPPRWGPPEIVLFPTPPRAGGGFPRGRGDKSSPQISKTTTGTTATSSNDDNEDRHLEQYRSSGSFHFDIDERTLAVAPASAAGYAWEEFSRDSSSTISTWLSAELQDDRNPLSSETRVDDEIRCDWQQPTITQQRQPQPPAQEEKDGFRVLVRQGILPKKANDAFAWPIPGTMTTTAVVNDSPPNIDRDRQFVLFPTRQPHSPTVFEPFVPPPQQHTVFNEAATAVATKADGNNPPTLGPWIDFVLPDNPVAPDSDFELQSLAHSPFAPIEQPCVSPKQAAQVASPAADRPSVALPLTSQVVAASDSEKEHDTQGGRIDTDVASGTAFSLPFYGSQRPVSFKPKHVQQGIEVKRESCSAHQMVEVIPSSRKRSGVVPKATPSEYLGGTMQQPCFAKRDAAHQGNEERLKSGPVQPSRKAVVLDTDRLMVSARGVVNHKADPPKAAPRVESKSRLNKHEIGGKPQAPVPRRRAPVLLGHLLEERYQAARRKCVLPNKPARASTSTLLGDSNRVDEQGTFEHSVKENPSLVKYSKMLKVGLPLTAVQNAMERDGVDIAAVSAGSFTPKVKADPSKLVEDPALAKYARMLKVGLPPSAVKNAMRRDGVDPSILDGGTTVPQQGISLGAATPEVAKDPYRRFRLHWETHSNVRSNTFWAMVSRDQEWLSEVQVDEEEIETLFRTQKKAAVTSEVAVTSRSNGDSAVRVIDPKRANNGGIALARIKLSYHDIARAIDSYDIIMLTLEQIRAILPYIPTAEEKQALQIFISQGDQNLKTECEKFMAETIKVDEAKRKLGTHVTAIWSTDSSIVAVSHSLVSCFADAMLFMKRFPMGIDELKNGTSFSSGIMKSSPIGFAAPYLHVLTFPLCIPDARLIRKACDEIMSASRLRKVLGIVLHLGNLLNTTGSNPKDMAGALQLESLLKLNQAKAFDKKTTFLEYAARIIRRYSPNLLQIKDDLNTLALAEKVNWEQTLVDLESMDASLSGIREMALGLGGAGHECQVGCAEGEEVLTPDQEVRRLQSTFIGGFTINASLQMGSVYGEIATSKRAFEDLLNYFGEEDRSDIDPQSVLKTILQFCSDFEQAVEQAIASEKQKAREIRSAYGIAAVSTKRHETVASSNSPKVVSGGPMGGVLSAIRAMPAKE